MSESLIVISKFIYSKLASEAFESLKRVFKNKKIEIVVSKEDLAESLNAHSKYIVNLTSNISFKELRGNKKLNDTYIELDLELQAVKYKDKERSIEKKHIEKIIDNTESHLIILGGPGAGKTTTVKKICQSLLFDESIKKYNFPILINLRDLSTDQTIYSRLKDLLGIQILLNKNNTQTLIEDKELRIKYINSYLDSLKAVIILDGLDEVNPIKLRHLNQEIKTLMLNLRDSLVIATCRSASYNLKIDNSLEYELCSLNKIQIEEFVCKWFANKDDSKKFLSEIRKSKFYDFSLKPISLAHLCAIYDRTKKFYDKPKSIYKKLVRILIEEWDEQRDIIRESNYSDFDNERKFDFLSHLAYDLTIRFDKKVYFEDDLKDSFFNIYESFGLPKNQCAKVIKEIEAHTGILIQSSYQTFEFVHKSMQEYLAAEHIVKMPEIPIKLLHNINISNELAITIALSSDPNSYFFKLIFDVFNSKKFTEHFIIEFLTRLAYEKPDFKESLLIPYSFTKLINNFKQDNIDTQKKIIKIIKEFKRIHTVKMSFKKYALFISTSIEDRKDYSIQETHLEIEEEEEEKNDTLNNFEVDLEIEEIPDSNFKKIINIELEKSFFENLNERENNYVDSIKEVSIPLNVFNSHFE